MLTLISYFLTHTAEQSEIYQAIASGLFILPFFLFSATAGQLADCFDKSKIVRVIKVFELLLICIGGYGLYIGHIWLMMVTLMGLGIHSTFFGPIKYAILPEHLPKSSLLEATSWIEAGTFLAILLGTVLGTLSVAGSHSGTLNAFFLTFIAALLGLVASLFIPAANVKKSKELNWNIAQATFDLISSTIKNKKILTALLAISWFWFIGAVILTKLPDYANYVLNADTTVFAFFLGLFSIGIAMGSFAINKILRGEVNLCFVPITMLFLSIFSCDLYWATPKAYSGSQTLTLFLHSLPHLRVAFDLFFLAFSGGLFIVPLYTYLQISCIETHRARTIAANNIFNAFFMVLGALLVMLLVYLEVEIPKVFLIIGLLNGVASGVFWFLLNDKRTA